MPGKGTIGPRRRKTIYEALRFGHHWSTACSLAETFEQEVLAELEYDATFFIKCRKERGLALHEMVLQMDRHAHKNESGSSNHLYKRYEALLTDRLQGDLKNVSQFASILAGTNREKETEDAAG